MKALAKTFVELYYELNFVEEEYAELDWYLNVVRKYNIQ